MCIRDRAGLYYLKLIEIDKEITIENEINTEAEGEVSGFNERITEIEKSIKLEIEKVTPLREKNIENLSKIQRLNLELQSLDKENTRTQEEIENIKKSLTTLDEDVSREKGIIIDANSNEKRLKEEKSDLIEVDSKYFETEKKSNEDLDNSKNNLIDEIGKIKTLISSNQNDSALDILNDLEKIIDKYADSYSKNQNIKKESIKRNERIKIIEKEIESWKNLLSNSEKMVNELIGRKNNLTNQLEILDNQPKIQAEKKGQISENLRNSEEEKEENEKIINDTDEKIDSLRTKLNEIQEQSIQIRERKASSGATVEGLRKRKNDLIDRITSELNLTEENILENSNLNGVEELPDAVNQEDLLDKKKQEREKIGSVLSLIHI